MSSHHRKKKGISIVEAVETLGAIADLEEEQLSLEYNEEVLAPGSTERRVVHWLRHDSPKVREQKVRSTFKVVLEYLRDFYENHYRMVRDRKLMDEMKSIMVLVGESAKKLDQICGGKSVKECPEYRRLQEFYRTRIAHKVEEGMLGKWILALTKRVRKFGGNRLLTGKPIEDTTKIFVDLEGVKSDREYELFFIRKENGEHYYSPRLLRNIKLVSDFEGYFGYRESEDPLFEVGMWRDFFVQQIASTISECTKDSFEAYCHEEKKINHPSFKRYMNSCLLALRMSANERNLLSRTPIKCCHAYFKDFLSFLRKVLHSGYYKKLIAYPSSQTNRGAQAVIDLVRGMCKELVCNKKGYTPLLSVIQETIDKAHEEIDQERWNFSHSDKMAWERLEAEHRVVKQIMKNHPSGSLNLLLEGLENGNAGSSFDPLQQDNLPTCCFSFAVDGQEVTVHRSATPTHQEFIQKALILEEYREFLKTQKQVKHLIINSQDRTHWKEYARCDALIKLANQREFKKTLTVVNFSLDSEFYHQLGVYADENYFEVFKELFKEQLLDDQSGFFIPSNIRKRVYPKFVEKTIGSIHEIFFSKKNVLSVKERQIFIDIFYTLFTVKLLSMTGASQLTMVCKDGIDRTLPQSVLLYVFRTVWQNGEFVDEDFDQMALLLYGPSLLIRERLIHNNRFSRMLSVIKRLEIVRDEMGIEPFKKALKKAFAFLRKN